MKPWQIIERHEKDMHAALVAQGALDAQGRVMRFDGGAFHEHIHANGHDSTDVDRCSCSEAGRLLRRTP